MCKDFSMRAKIVFGLVSVSLLGLSTVAIALEQTAVTPTAPAPVNATMAPNPTSDGVTQANITSPADTSETQDSVVIKKSANQEELNPGLTPDAVDEITVDQLIEETTKPSDQLPNGINRKAGFSAYDYLNRLKACEVTTISAGADAVAIKGYKRGRCHVVYSIAGRKVDCMLTHRQISQMTTPDKLKQAREFDRGVGIMLRPLGSDDIDSPLANCVQ